MATFKYRVGHISRVQPGTYNALITSCEPKENSYYTPEKKNSAPYQLETRFTLENPQTLEEQSYMEFINAIAFDGSTFDQLCRLALPYYNNEDDSQEIEADQFVGAKMQLEIEEYSYTKQDETTKSGLRIKNISPLKK